MSLVAACSGSDDDAARKLRQERLRPRDLAAERKAQYEKTREKAADGSLLPSDEVVAGVVLPRGLELVHRLDGRHYYRTRASLEALRAYFGPRLFTGKIEQGGRGRVTYVNAKPKDSPEGEKHLVTVQIGPAPSDPRFNDVYLKEMKLNPVEFPTETEVRAKLEARRKYAD